MRTLWYFSADWCNPCKSFGPTMDLISQSGIPVKKVNIDYTPDVVQKFGVRSVPTVILVENDKEINRFVGAKSKQQVVEFYNQ